MAKGKLEEIIVYVDDMSSRYEKVLMDLERLCIKGRDRTDEPVPIYLTKYRVKKPESVYLKTKRKNKDYKDFTDYAGLRLLCLFEQDIVRVFEYFLQVLKENNYRLGECYAYNWDEKSDAYFVLKKVVSIYYPGYTIMTERKISGYKSIHCLVYDKSGLVIEVQLRTLVQDVWSELEHKLSYKKGSVHPHIKKSFSLLSKDLQNIDELFSHLRDISDKEKGGEVFSNYNIGPKCYFEYEEYLHPSLFDSCQDISGLYKKYWDILSEQKVLNVDGIWVSELRGILEEMKRKCDGKYEEDKKLKYWIDMEEAFVLFCERKYDESIQLYDTIRKYADEKYCIYYRLGELYFIKENSEIALNYFDKSESLLDESDHNNLHNHFLIKSRLALTYWSLGDEYMDIAIKEAKKAAELYERNEKTEGFTVRDGNVIINSLCWYYLERYIIAVRNNDIKKIDGYFTDLELQFEKLMILIDGEEKMSVNALDTAMWYYYHKYKRTKDDCDLRKAYEYALRMKGKAGENLSFKLMNLHINHIQEVMQCFQVVFEHL